jgi:hypothetical protein
MAAKGSTRKNIELNATTGKVPKEEKKDEICDACGKGIERAFPSWALDRSHSTAHENLLETDTGTIRLWLQRGGNQPSK